MGCARYGQSPNPTKTRRNKRAKSQISQSAVRRARGKDVSFLENDALDTGKLLPINALHLATKETSEC